MPPPRTLAALLACLLACLAGWRVEAAPAEGAAGTVRAPRSATNSWLQLLEEYTRRGDSGSDSSFPRPVPISLPVGGSQVPVLIVPVPVPSQHSARSQCDAGKAAPEPEEHQDAPLIDKRLHSPTVSSDSASSTGTHFSAQSSAAHSSSTHSSGSPTPPPNRLPFGARFEEPAFPVLDFIGSSQQLVRLYREQVAASPELPPAVIPDYTAGEETPPDGTEGTDGGDFNEVETPRYTRQVRMRRYQPSGFTPAPPVASSTAPPVPRFDRSLMLRGEVTVPRSGYTEPYTVWWDSTSGAARVDLHGGATSTYRSMLADGRVQGVEMRVDRSGDREVRRCAVTAPRPVTPEDRALPALPDLSQFSFAGYEAAEFGRVERWTRTVAGGSGELGGARGEALTFRHELLAARAPDNVTVSPLKYSVKVDSSVLGADSDGYSHRYTELRDMKHDPAMLRLDLGEACEEVVSTARRDRVDPLREFTLPHRDPRHDADYTRFKDAHRRQYADDTEEAVRKALLVQHARFVDSGNRQGATFGMEVNHLGDRLDAELRVLRGVREDELRAPGEPFPHSRDQLAAMRARLPTAFDWRDRGAVTHVRNQGSCSSCWAFAVTGATEGALFVRTRRLVPLSEQCLVDCAQPYGAHGCGGTWPSAAYEYVRERGLPALAAYPEYRARVLPCAARQVPPVTRIAGHVNVTSHSVQALKVAIRRHAPTVVIIDSTAKSFVFYKRGVIDDDRCAKNKAEHAVLAVGWGATRGAAHFVLKNSWSAAWGEAGYVRVAAAPNTCGVLSRPSYPRLERADVVSLPPGDDALRD